MKINRSSWHYRFRAWAMREEGYENLIERKYSRVRMGEYIFDVVFGVTDLFFWPFRRLWKRLNSIMGAAEFYNDKEER